VVVSFRPPRRPDGLTLATARILEATPEGECVYFLLDRADDFIEGTSPVHNSSRLLYSDAMWPTLKRIVFNFFNFENGYAVIMVWVFCAVVSAAHAWSETTRSKASAVTFAVLALLFICRVAVLVLRAVRRREYERVITSLGFVPLDWNSVPFIEVLPVVFANKRKVIFSRVVHGEAYGTHVYLFHCARDTWLSKKKTTVVMERPQVLAAGEGVDRRLSEKGDAELAFHNHWWMIQARREIVPTALPRWLEIVLGIATRS